MVYSEQLKAIGANLSTWVQGNKVAVMVVAAVIVVIVFIVLFKKSDHIVVVTKKPEEEQRMEAPQEEHMSGSERPNPEINPQVGSIIDGPGSEAGPVDGIAQKSGYSRLPGDYYFLDDGSADKNLGMLNNLVSKSCCSPQWPTPFHAEYDGSVCASKTKFVPTNYFGNTSFQSSGCLCVSPQQQTFLYNRGNNGRELF